LILVRVGSAVMPKHGWFEAATRSECTPRVPRVMVPVYKQPSQEQGTREQQNNTQRKV
jgi:hypothetical protein